MRHFLAILLFLFSLASNGEVKEPTPLKEKPHPVVSEFTQGLSNLETRVARIESNQINYRLEKDLLKETYSVNYERINIVVTFILAVIAAIGFLGIRDIGQVKDKYEAELTNLKALKSEFELKSGEFDSERHKIDTELREIISENKNQNQKIKFLELKGRIVSLYKDGEILRALELINLALKTEAKDLVLLSLKGKILIRLGHLNDGATVFKDAFEANPEFSTTRYNLIEALHLKGDIAGAKSYIADPEEYEGYENGKLKELLYLWELAHAGKVGEMKRIVASYITAENLKEKEKKMSDNFGLEEATKVAHDLPEGEVRTAILYIVGYWDGQVSGEQLLKKLDLPIPTL